MSFTNLILTAGGKGLYAKAELGQGLHFCRVAVGDGVLTGPATSRTALVSEKMSLGVDGKRLVNGGMETAIITTMDNKDLTAGFFYREVGIFAADPDTGAEVLCLYDNAGADAEEIPPGSLKQVYERLVFILRLDSTMDVTFTWSGNPLYPTLDEFEAEIARLDSELLVLRQDISPAEEKAEPVDGDSVVLTDSADGGKKKKLTWGNIKTSLGAVFAALKHVHAITDVSELESSLSKKVSIPTLIPPGANLDTYKTPGWYFCNNDVAAATIQNAPIPVAFSLLVETMFDGAVFQTVNHWRPEGGFSTDTSVHVRCSYTTWENWKRLATDTKPVERTLPLVEGTTGIIRCRKDQFGFVTVHCVLDSTSGIPGWTIFSTLPVGFRPVANARFPAIGKHTPTDLIQFLSVGVLADGSVYLVHTGAPAVEVEVSFGFWVAAPPSDA